MKIFGYYFKAVILPSLAVIFLTFIYTSVENYNYKSEWQTPQSVILTSMLTALTYSVTICLLSLTVFLNKIKKIRKNKVILFLTWFLFPFAFMSTILIHEIHYHLKYNENSFRFLFFPLILNVPFFIGIILTYLKFEKNINTS